MFRSSAVCAIYTKVLVGRHLGSFKSYQLNTDTPRLIITLLMLKRFIIGMFLKHTHKNTNKNTKLTKTIPKISKIIAWPLVLS